MAKGFVEELMDTSAGLIFLAACLALSFFALLFLFVGIAGFVGVRLYRDSPTRRERLARQETARLYQRAQAGSVILSPEEIDAALVTHWPVKTPGPLCADLLAIGRELFTAEGLAPDILPPPAICNSVEGARYRDRLARLGQARHDWDLLLSVLHTISESLAVVARAVPQIDSDIRIDVAQFLSPPGAAVQAIIAPYFRDASNQPCPAARLYPEHSPR